MEESTCAAETGHLIEDKNEESQKTHKTISLLSKVHITIEPAICAMFLSTNLSEFIITNLIMERICNVQLKMNETECSYLGSNTDAGHKIEAIVQPYASVLLTGKSLLGSILPVIMSLFLGPWSDRNGRKLLLLAPILGLSFSFLMYAGFSYYANVAPAYILLAQLPFTICGGYINFVSAAYSYISDISCEENRALRLGVVEAALYIGILVGVTSNYQVYNINKHYGYVITFSISALTALLAFLYILFFVPESIHPNEDFGSRSGIFQLKFLKEIFTTSFKARASNGRALICLSIIVMTTSIVAMEGEGILVYLFTRLRFGWDLKKFTFWSSVHILTSFVGLIFGCVVLTKVFKVPDITLVLISFLMKFVECTMYGVVPSSAPSIMFWAQLAGLLGAVAGPGMRSVVSKSVPKKDVGKVFFLVTSCESLFPLAFTPLYTALYNSTMKSLPGAFFLLSAFFFLVDLILCSIICFLQRKSARITAETF